MTKEKRHHGEIHRQSTSFFQWLGQTRLIEAWDAGPSEWPYFVRPYQKTPELLPKFNEI